MKTYRLREFPNDQHQISSQNISTWFSHRSCEFTKWSQKGNCFDTSNDNLCADIVDYSNTFSRCSYYSCPQEWHYKMLNMHVWQVVVLQNTEICKYITYKYVYICIQNSKSVLYFFQTSVISILSVMRKCIVLNSKLGYNVHFADVHFTTQLYMEIWSN